MKIALAATTVAAVGTASGESSGIIEVLREKDTQAIRPVVDKTLFGGISN